MNASNTAHALAVKTAAMTGDAHTAAVMGALWDAFNRKNASVRPMPGESAEDFAAAQVDAFFAYCRSAHGAGAFDR